MSTVTFSRSQLESADATYAAKWVAVGVTADGQVAAAYRVSSRAVPQVVVVAEGDDGSYVVFHDCRDTTGCWHAQGAIVLARKMQGQLPYEPAQASLRVGKSAVTVATDRPDVLDRSECQWPASVQAPPKPLELDDTDALFDPTDFPDPDPPAEGALEGVPGDTEWPAILAYLRREGCDPALIDRVRQWRATYRPVSLAAPTVLFHGAELGSTLRALIGGFHVLLSGPKATGKNTLALTVGWVLGRPVTDLAGHAQLAKEDLLAEVTLQVDAASGQVVTQKALGVLAEAARDGVFLVADELNAIPPDVLISAHALLDGRRRLTIPGVGVVEAAPAFRVIGTMNAGYAGTRPLNEATADRFVVIDMQPRAGTVSRLLEEVVGLDRRVRRALITFFERLADAVARQECDPAVLSVRGMLAAASLIALGETPVHALQMGVVNKVPPEDRDNVSELLQTLFSDSRGGGTEEEEA